jgi:uroporphyrinogen-III synthase
MGVLVTRPAAQAEGLCRLIEAAGGRAIPFPAIAIQPVNDQGTARRLLAEPWDLMVFISRNAV